MTYGQRMADRIHEVLARRADVKEKAVVGVAAYLLVSVTLLGGPPGS
jgi:hypothetical protein